MIKKGFLVLFLLTLFAGCKSEPYIERNAFQLDTSDRTLALLTETRWDKPIRKKLAWYGFPVKHYTLAKKGATENERKSAARRAGIRYGLRIIPGEVVDQCIANKSAIKFDTFRIELIDLRKDEVELIIEKGGWIETCPLASPAFNFTPLFQELIETFVKQWW
ncbi:MAG: hypothetical protein FVQ80_07435 [Planctomycetes bacterium]|nr:hypothetical protein [Planctomycetota bacterium]